MRQQPRAHFEYNLSEVQRALLQLGSAVEQAIVQAMRALQRNDTSAARRIMRADDNIDERRADVEDRVLTIVAAQQPLATDLRFLLSVVRIADDLERMGDYAEGIAALVLRAVDEPAMDLPPELEAMTEHVQPMLHTSVEAFVARDAGAVEQLEAADDQIDELNRTLQASMVRHIQNVPQQAARALYYLFVGHNLERIADRTVNIAERTAFIATGMQREHRRVPRS